MNRSTGYLLALVGIFAILAFLVVQPFIQYVLFAILLAYVLKPLQDRLEERISSTIAAFILVLVAIALFVVPIAVVVAAVAGDAIRIIQNLDPSAFRIEEVESRIQELTGVEVDLVDSISGSGREIGMFFVDRSTEAFGQLTHVLVGLGVALFLVYYLLKDGDDLVAWIHHRTPLPEDVQNDLYGEIDDVMWAVLLGHVLIAVVQGGIAGLGLMATGVPNATFWTFVMIVLALIPLVGAFLVWGPASAYLALTGEPLFAVGLFVYSLTVVSISDDYLRPLLVDRYAQISPAVIIIGVLGGIYAFGVMGLFFGPVVLGTFIATVNVLVENWERLESSSEGTRNWN